MSHGRTQIRAALKTALTGLTTTGSNVHVDRERPVRKQVLPILLILTGDEQIETGTTRPPRTQVRVLNMSIDCIASADGAAPDVDATLDTIISEVEAAVYANRTLGGLVRDIRVDSIDHRIDEGSEAQVGAASISVFITWVAAEGSPESPL